MPIYEYYCQKCGKTTESIEKLDTDYVVCECDYVANRIVSATNFKLKGSCWAKDNYSSKKKHPILDNPPK